MATALAVTLAACGGSSAPATPVVPVPPRAATAGERLLPLLPPGAQVIIELDLQRARANPVLGPLAAAWIDHRAAPEAGAVARGGLGELARTPLGTATAVVIAAYHVGSTAAQSLTLVAGGDAAALGAAPIREGVIGLGPAALITVAQQRGARGAGLALEPSLEPSMLALRARPMPEGAAGALLRVTAELSFEARVELARQTNLDPPPARLAVWMDAVDDAAAVVLAEADEARDPRVADRLQAAVRGVLAELAGDARVAAVGLGPALRDAKIDRQGTWLKVAVVVGPRRWARAIARAVAWTSPAAPTPAAPTSAAPTSTAPTSGAPTSSGLTPSSPNLATPPELP